ncbi:Uncharacterised protein [Mycobacteroides abscessus subsp. abscessus]|nr:Uncharacterised protein [Mycobacteroides abscessus subsp. abscessus]
MRPVSELREFVDDDVSFRGMAPDADSLVCRRLPCCFVDDYRVPSDFPFETRGTDVLTDPQRHVETELLDSLIGAGHVIEIGDLDV